MDCWHTSRYSGLRRRGRSPLANGHCSNILLANGLKLVFN